MNIMCSLFLFSEPMRYTRCYAFCMIIFMAFTRAEKRLSIRAKHHLGGETSMDRNVYVYIKGETSWWLNNEGAKRP